MSADQRKCYWRFFINRKIYQFAEHFGLSLRLPQVVVNEVVDCADLLLDFLQPFGVGGKGVFQFIIFLDGLNDVGFEILQIECGLPYQCRFFGWRSC